MSEQMRDVAVIGAGGAGIMAHLRAVLNRDNSVIFKGDADSKRRSRATWVHEVENIPGMHGIKNPISTATSQTLKWLKTQPELAGYSTEINGKVQQIEKLEQGFRLHYTEKKESKTLDAHYVILATGVMDVQPLIQGSIEPVFPFANRGDFLYCLRCDGHQTIGHRLSIIGSGDKTVFMGALLTERYGHQGLDILTHGQPALISREQQALADAYQMKFHTSEIVEILGEPKVALEGFKLADGTVVHTSKSIIALGTIVYNDLAKQLSAELESDGRIRTNDVFESSVPGLFAVGDLVAGTRMQVYTAWDEAVVASEEINRRLRLARRHQALAKHQNSQYQHSLV